MEYVMAVVEWPVDNPIIIGLLITAGCAFGAEVWLLRRFTEITQHVNNQMQLGNRPSPAVEQEMERTFICWNLAKYGKFVFLVAALCYLLFPQDIDDFFMWPIRNPIFTVALCVAAVAFGLEKTSKNADVQRYCWWIARGTMPIAELCFLFPEYVRSAFNWLCDNPLMFGLPVVAAACYLFFSGGAPPLVCYRRVTSFFSKSKKVPCPNCRGTGKGTSGFLCWTCSGVGKIDPVGDSADGYVKLEENDSKDDLEKQSRRPRDNAAPSHSMLTRPNTVPPVSPRPGLSSASAGQDLSKTAPAGSLGATPATPPTFGSTEDLSRDAGKPLIVYHQKTNFQKPPTQVPLKFGASDRPARSNSRGGGDSYKSNASRAPGSHTPSEGDAEPQGKRQRFLGFVDRVKAKVVKK